MQQYRRILVASEAMRQEYLRNGFPPERLEFVSPPVAPRGNDSPEQIGSAAPVSPPDWTALSITEPIHLLFAGRMVALKGGKVLLDSLPHVVRRLARPLVLNLAGDGPARSEWERRARAICARNPLVKVNFKGWLDSTELQAEFLASDLLVVPSLWPEPFGCIGPEAGMNYLPAAAFAVGGISEWLQDGVNGFLALANLPAASGLADAIVKCLADPARHRQLRRGAHEVATELRVEHHRDALLRIFTEVATQAATTAPMCAS
jgi:glycosyltransferase involved in cell wall biosynthesis